MLAYEAEIRVSLFLLAFSILAVLEYFYPRRKLLLKKTNRWLNNLALLILNVILLRLLFPMAAVGAAVIASDHSLGVFNTVHLPLWLEITIAILVLDLAIYLQHVLFHKIGFLWRIHRVHHADLDMDITTGLRFHPVEMLLSMAIKFALVIAIGAPVLAVLIFEVLLNILPIFNHGNIKLPAKLDHILRYLIVTPDMHRIHHSSTQTETDSNYGFNASFWDRIFSTYTNQPAAGHIDMQIGLKYFRDAKQTNRLLEILKLPFNGRNL